LQYSIISGNTDNSFRIGTCSGQLYTTKPLDHEGTNSFQLKIRVQDTGVPSYSVDATVGVTVTNRNEPPTFPTSGDYSFEVKEDAGVGGAFTPASAGAVDPDGDTLTYSLIGNDQSAVAINTRTGKLTVAKPAHFDYELPAQQVRSFRIKACDAEFCVEQDVTVTIINRNDAPVVLPSQKLYIAEGSSVGTSVGTVNAEDEDAGSTLTYSIVSGNTGNAFSIASSTGELKVASTLDYETRSSYTLVIRASDNGVTGDTASKIGEASVTVIVDNVNEAPSLRDMSTSLDENDGSAKIRPLVSSTLSDPDGTDGTFFYTLDAGNVGSKFALSATGELSLTSPLDYEDVSSYSLTVKVTDGGGLSATATYGVTVNDLPEPPALMMGQTFAVPENTGASAGSLGQVNATDIDTSASQLSFSLIESSGSRNFRISSGGVLSLAPDFVPNYEVSNSYQLTGECRTDRHASAIS